MNRHEILESAENCVCGNREQDYGSPEDNFNRIAIMWSGYKGVSFEAKDVAAMLALMKIARIGSGNAKDDNWVDLAGYAACGGEIESNAAAAVNCKDCVYNNTEPEAPPCFGCYANPKRPNFNRG